MKKYVYKIKLLPNPSKHQTVVFVTRPLMKKRQLFTLIILLDLLLNYLDKKKKNKIK